jgi:hypothetical protein
MRVLQISLDIVCGDESDGFDLADYIAEELNRRGFKVVGAGFQEDVTEFYEDREMDLRR